MKKLLCFLLIAGMLLSLQIFPTVFADNYSDLCQLLVESCTNGTEVDISQFGLNEDSLDAAFVDVWYGGKLPWNVYSYNYSITSTGAVTSFAPIYYDRTEYAYDLYEQTVQDIIDQVIVENMTQWEMALAVHDYLIVNSCYDETLQRNTNYDLLVNGTAVCSGYAMAYMDIMNRLGIECRFVESQPMLHAWNLVKIDGSWYHVDVTHDDPTPDGYGYVSHERFLKTDQEMKDLGYYGWDPDIACTTQQPWDTNWADMTIFTEDSIYRRVKDGNDYTIERQHRSLTGHSEYFYTIAAQALTLEEDAYYYESNGLSLSGGRLWFSGVDRVWSMLPDGTDVQTVFRYDTQENGKFIYGSFVKDGMLYLTLSDGQYQFSSQVVALEDSAEHTHEYKKTKLDATCTQAGGVTYLCACGVCYDEEPTPALGHTYESYITQPATCQQEGEKTYLCIRCDDCYTEPYADPYAHSDASVILTEATFWKAGIKQSTCRICGRTMEEPVDRLTVEDVTGLKPWVLICGAVLIFSLPFLIVTGRKNKW
ncbi:MAG: hypothetical protein IKK41_00305 [Oscillospiraceae bacterium]|nr:hypothetical protein [Oscillospiraceae bacterium]